MSLTIAWELCMSLSNGSPEPSRDIAKRLFRTPLYLYQLGWEPLMNWIPLLILTTRGRNSGAPHHAVIEYRRHGSKYYVVSGWGADTDWYRNIQSDNRVTIQHGSLVCDARAHKVEDAAEALRALYMFSRNSWIYESLFARMSSAQAADLNTLAEVVEEFTVLRLEPTEESPTLPVIEPFSPPVRQFAAFLALLVAWRLALSILRPLFPERGRDDEEH
jgi:deazaflavin-dependent oxidoreductase (nitroreductase family)